MKQKTQKLCKRVIAMVCAVSMVLGGVLSDMGTMVTQAAAEHTLWLVGDSTVCSFTDSYYYPRYGYGTQIGNYLDGTYEVKNLALSGRSSKSFLSESNYTTLKNGIKAGDVLVVGFGHNDEKAEADRYTNPNGDYNTEGSFAKSLYDNYVKVAQGKEAEVILCTPIVRRSKNEKLSDSECHVTTGSDSYPGGDYAQAIRDLGDAVKVPVVDLTALTKKLYEEIGPSETLYLHAWTSNKEASVDNTHLNIYGAKKVAWLFANAAKETDTTVAAHINLDAGEPTKEKDLESNPDYVPPVYNSNLADSEIFEDYVIGDGDSEVRFKGTAFGMLGGNPSATYHILETDVDGNMHVAVTGNKGKINDAQDGLVMYYYKVPASSTFKLSAKATVNALVASSEVAFGLMARDDMYIDTYNTTLTTDYVAAGALGAGCNCFYRKNSKLGGRAALTTETFAAGKSYNLSIESNSDGYACTFGNEPTQTGGYDFQLTSVDSENVYIGMFATRNVDVTYNNIYLEIDGKVVVDTRKTEYTVTVSSDENGTAKANKTVAAQGETVTLTATPSDGYLFKEWKVVSGDVTIESNQFKMPAGAVEVKAIFEKIRTEWDFTKDDTIAGAAGLKVEGNTGTLAGLQIDATNGKFDSTGSLTSGWVQVNANTVITVPVTGPCKVTVNCYDTSYTVDGKGATTKVETFVCEGKKKQVVIKTTANTYLVSIKVEELAWVAAGLTEFNKIEGLSQGDEVPPIKGISLNNIKWNDNQHGLAAANGSTMTLSLQHKANVSVVTCCHGAGANATVTPSSGTVSSKATTEAANNTTGMEFTVLEADAGDLKLTFGGGTVYVHSIFVEYIIEVGPRNIDVWDIGGKLEEDEELYTNNITPDDWIDAEVVEDKLITKEVTFGDLTITPALPAGGDRLYTNVEALKALNNGNFSPAQREFEDGYKSAGAFYSNGTGGEKRRYLTIANVQAGDKIVAYMGVTQKNDSQFFFEGLGGAKGQKDTVEAKTDDFRKYEFVAQKTGSYKIWENNLGKPMYFRVMRVPGMQVTGKITFPEGFDQTDYSLKFVNQSNKQETVATLNEDNTYSVVLTPGYAYNAVLTGATGWGITSATKVLQTEDAETLTGKEKDLVVEAKTTYSYTGKIVGFASDYDISKLVVEMVPEAGNDVNPNADAVEVTFTDKATLSFTVTLEPDVPYNVRLSGGVSDYQVKSPEEVAENGAYTADIEVELKAKYQVTGGLVDLNGNKIDAKDATLSFVLNETEGEGSLAKTYTYKYPATLTEAGYSVELRAGEYEVEAQIDGYSSKTHVVVENKAVKKDLLFVAPADTSSLERVADIYVGYPKKDHNYATVREAVAACARMKPTSEDQRIKIHIAPGTYREQVIVETPYISFVNDEASKGKEVLLTWYYGIGYQYYSANNGFYDAESAFDKYKKGIADRWGTCVRITTKATAFRAEGIIFENSFNRYVTDEEIEDGVEVSGEEDIRFVRELGVDVTTKAATERAAAIAVEGAHSEFYNCQFLSSQDTLYTQGDAYFKNCLIEGMTDYIYGQGTCVFDACELSWKGYEAGNKTGGYITAAQTKTDQKGYLFRNCVVTNKSGTAAAGDLGRPWGKGDSKTMFLNTKLESADLITARGWYEMSGFKPAAVPGYQEYNTVSLDGKTLDFSDPDRTCHIMTDEAAAAVKVTDYFIGWTPAYYTEEEENVAFATAPSLSDNGDMNLLRPGHTLTVHYSLGKANDANDASIIRWYRVKGEEKTLLKTSSAVTDKTYKVAAEDTGSKIMAEVTPGTVSGKAGTAQSCTTPETVGEGYEDPSGGSDIELGNGINIFLAGDSTVKDYSAKGMYNSGKALSEGAWGEFLQAYFDPAKVTIQNYAQGGRSSRNFINEGKLDAIANNIKAGDYLFIQFGHNDSSNGDSNHVDDRYAPIGTPVDGVYPSNAGTLNAEGKYTWDCGGTYKWYLEQYIKVAREKGAIPVLVTPVARMYYKSDGTINPHHDETLTGFVAADLDDMATANANKKNNNKDNSYVKAVQQLAKEEDVLLLDAFALTENIFVTAYNDAKAANVTPNSTYGQQIMAVGDSTHNNKVGGMIEAAAIASAIQNMGLDISKAVKAPQGMTIKTPDGKNAFTVTNASKLTMYDMLQDYGEEAEYWTATGQKMIDAIAEKANELNGSGENPEQYTITIDRQNGSELVEKEIEAGTALTEADLPSNLTRDGYTFKGWFDEAGEAITAPYTPAGSMTIKARWEKIVAEDELAITIDKGDGSDLVEKVIKKGTELTETDLPSTLTREGYTFQGWVDEDNNAITVPYKPTKSMTIKAKWSKVVAEDELAITIDRQNGTALVEKVIKKGTELTETDLPSTLTREGYTFQGWVDEDGKAITVPYKPTKSMTIKAKWLSDAAMIGLHVELAVPNKTYVYTGSAIKPAIIVTNNGELLTEGTDYTVKYSNNIKACKWEQDEVAPKKAPTITVTGKGNLTGSTSTNFCIAEKNIGETDIAGGTASVKAGAVVVVKGSKADPILVYNGVKLGKNDYKVVETTADASGKFTANGTIQLEGQNNFTGNRTISVEVVESKQDLPKFKVTVNKVDYAYKDGKVHDADVTVTGSDNATLVLDEDYMIVYSTEDRESAGTVKFIVLGLGKYSGTVAKSFVVKPRKVNDLTAELKDSNKEYPFNSAGVTVGDDLVVKDPGLSGAVLELGKDYKVSCSNNKKIGDSAKYTVTFLGNYKGSKAVSGTFKIKAVALNNQGNVQTQTAGLKIALTDKIYKKPGVYKSVPYVTLNGVALKKSDYKVDYYLDEKAETPMSNANKVTIADEENCATVYVKITGKGNYASADGEYVIASYKVWKVGQSATGEDQMDLSKARVTFYDKAKYDSNGNETDAKKVTKLSYTGKEITPGDAVVEIKVGRNWVRVPESQYNVVYVNNVNKGKATAVINATGDGYVGSKTATFSIVARNLKTDENGLLANLFKAIGK